MNNSLKPSAFINVNCGSETKLTGTMNERQIDREQDLKERTICAAVCLAGVTILTGALYLFTRK